MYSHDAGTGVGGEGTSRGSPEHFSREFELRKPHESLCDHGALKTFVINDEVLLRQAPAQ